MHWEAGLTYLRAAAVKLEPAEKEDFDMMMLMLSNLMIMMRDAEALKLGDQHNADALKLDDDDAVGLKPGDAYNAALEFCDDQHNAALELDDYYS